MSLISLTVPGDVAKKLIHYLKQKLPSSCLSDLFSSHAFTKHYLKRGGGGGLEDEELLGEDASHLLLISITQLSKLLRELFPGSESEPEFCVFVWAVITPVVYLKVLKLFPLS